MVETIGASQFACQQFTEAGILGELITTPLSENSVGGASGQGIKKISPVRSLSNKELRILEFRMSAIGTKRTSRRAQPMSAFGGKADITGRQTSVCLAACGYRPERLDLALADADIPVVHIAGGITVPRHEPQLLIDLQHALGVVDDTVLV